MKKVEHAVEYKPLDELCHLERNPRKISKENMEKLVKSIKANPDYFEARPIICSDRTGKLVIIAGNQRLRAAKTAGLSEVPVVVLHGLSEERERLKMARSGDVIIKINTADILKLEKDGETILFNQGAEEAIFCEKKYTTLSCICRMSKRQMGTWHYWHGIPP